MAKPAIICVDDEQVVLISLRNQLSQVLGRDYQIELAESGEEALEIFAEFREDNIEVALIITDQIMPGIKGDELLLNIHQQSPKTLKIMLTGQADLEAVGNAVNSANLYRYLSKPWQPEDLNLTVKEALKSYLKDQQLAQQKIKLKQANKELAKFNRNQTKLIEQLQDSQRKLQAIFDQTFQFTGVLNPEGILLEVNQTAVDFSGLSSSELLGKPFWQCHWWTISQATQNKLQAAIYQAVAGKFIRYEVDVLGVGGIVITIDFSVKPILNKKGDLDFLIVEGRDISDRKKAEAEREKFTQELLQLNKTFSSFVPSQFLQFLQKDSILEVQPGEAIQKEMSILFSDIRGFTNLSEKMTPRENFRFINSYLSRMSPAIIENQGFIDKYVGDGIMALFDGEADNAVKAGISMLQRLKLYNQHRGNCNYVPIRIGIGINTGDLMLGIVGEESRMDTSVISDAVNLASRLEVLTKTYRVPLLISHHTFSQLQTPHQYAIRFIDQVKVKGKLEKVTVYEVFDSDSPEIKEGKLSTKTSFEEAWLLYHQQDFQPAARIFANCYKENPGDTVAKVYLERCQQKILP